MYFHFFLFTIDQRLLSLDFSAIFITYVLSQVFLPSLQICYKYVIGSTVFAEAHLLCSMFWDFSSNHVCPLLHSFYFSHLASFHLEKDLPTFLLS